MAWRHTSSVLRYPLTVFAEGTDYIQIDVQKYTPVRKKTITKNFEMVPTMVGPYLFRFVLFLNLFLLLIIDLVYYY